MGEYRKKSIIIEAVQLSWESWDEICAFVGVGKLKDGKTEGTFIDTDGNPTNEETGHMGLLIPTLEGVMIARDYDWIIKGIRGEYYPCKPDIFEETYDAV